MIGILQDRYLLDYPYHNRLSFIALASRFARICRTFFRLRRISLCPSVVAVVTALTFLGEIHALPSNIGQFSLRDRETKLGPLLLLKNVDVVLATKDNGLETIICWISWDRNPCRSACVPAARLKVHRAKPENGHTQPGCSHTIQVP